MWFANWLKRLVLISSVLLFPFISNASFYSETFESYTVGTDLTGEGWTWDQFGSDVSDYDVATGKYGDCNVTSGTWGGGYTLDVGESLVNYTVTFDIASVSGGRWIFGFRHKDGTGYWVQHIPSSELRLITGGTDYPTSATVIKNWDGSAPATATSGEISVHSNIITLTVNDVLIGSHVDHTYTAGTIGISSFTTGWEIDNIVITDDSTNLVIENLDNDNDTADEAGVPDAGWGYDPIYTITMTTNIDYNTTPLVKVDYDKAVGEEWAYIGLNNLDGAGSGNITDFSKDHILSFHAKGSTDFLIKFKDGSDVETSDSGTISVSDTGTWEVVQWDYSAINWNGADPTDIKEVLIFPHPGQSGTGTYYFDNMKLGTPAALPEADNSGLPYFGIGNKEDKFIKIKAK